jgi:hypothetical protein
VRADVAVPSGELSSTNITSQSHDVSRCDSRSTNSGILARSLNVGTTMVSSGAGRTTGIISARAGSADGLAAGISMVDCGNAVRLLCRCTYCPIRIATLLAFSGFGKGPKFPVDSPT